MKSINEAIKYTGKILSYLPIINGVNSLVNYVRVRKSNKIESFGDTRGRVTTAYLILAALYVSNGVQTNAWTPEQYKEYKRRVKTEELESNQYKDEISVSYDSLNIFENAKNYDDSIDIIKKYKIPFKLKTPKIEDKERIVQQSILEKKALEN